MIKKYFFILMSFFVFFSSVNYSDATIDEAINAARPDRSTPWYLSDKPNVTFNEYYISTTNLACGFRAFGYDSRKAAIKAMLKALADQNPRYKKRNEKLREYIKNDYAEDISVEEYLRKIKNTQYELSYNPNKQLVENGTLKKIDEPRNVPCTLINAFALLTHKNLYIYNVYPNENKSVFLSHSFVDDNGRVNEDLFLLCKGIHYNRLVPTGHQGTNTCAKDAEDKYLTELRLRLIQEEAQFQEFETAVMCQPDMSQRIISNNNNASEFQENNVLINEDDYIISIDDESEDECLDEFSACDIRDFVFGQSKTILNLTIDQSNLAAYQQAKNVFDRKNALFVHVQLYLKKNYVPNASFIEGLITKLDALIKKKGSKSKTKKYRHYASIFKGQIYVKMNKLNDAWDIFNNLYIKNNNYTKTFWLDMAEMILLHEYMPKDMTREAATTLAWDLFDKRVSTEDGARSQSSSSLASRNIVIKPDYYRSKISNNRRKKVLLESEKRNNLIEVQDDVEVNTNSQSILNQNSAMIHPNNADQFVLIGDNRPNTNNRSQNISGRKRSNRINRLSNFNKIAATSNNLIDNDNSVEIVDLNDSYNFLNQVDENNHKNEALRKFILEGKYYCAIKNSNKALACFQKVTILCEGDHRNIYYVQALIGRGHARDPERLQCYQEAEEIARDNGYKELECEALIGRGNARDPKGLQCYREVEKIARDNGYTELECQALIGRGHARDPKRLQYEFYRDAETIAHGKGYKELECKALIGRGHARDPKKQQYEFHREAEKIARENGYTELLCQALIGRGHARDSEDLQCYKDAEKIAHENGWKELECEALIGRGNARDLQELQCYQDAEKIANNNGYKELECQALIGRGNARDPERLHCYQKAEDIARENGYRKLRYDALMGMGNYYSHEKRQNKDALYCYEDAFKLNISRSDSEKAQKEINRVKRFL